ncbi:hypothetical protein [Sphingomicrobium marinum]|uniref:hypothetical protein n=1 Tax=Sphingomicrobium marinum TaxID=1227950 RepID=UPI00223EE985|nr:hypothetical protein [Sphingomicrobium marinum]
MKHIKLIACIVAAPLMIAAAGPEEEAAAAAAAEKQQAEAGADDRNVMVCKKFDPPTGTRAARKRQICKSKAEWEMMEKEAYDTVDRVQRKPYQR